MGKKLKRKLHSLRCPSPDGLFPALTSALFVSGILLTMLNGYSDYRYQLSKARHNETLAEQRLNEPTRMDKEALLLQKNLSALFKSPQAPSLLTDEQYRRQRYALRSHHLTDAFFMSCPPAGMAANVVGLVSGDNKNRNLAVIAYRGRESSYSVADLLDEKINIVRIFPDRVIVNDHGYCAALLMN